MAKEDLAAAAGILLGAVTGHLGRERKEKETAEKFSEEQILKKGYSPLPAVGTPQAAARELLRRERGLKSPSDRINLRGQDYGPTVESELANLTDLEKDVYELWKIKKEKAEFDKAQKRKAGLVEGGGMAPESMEFEGVKYGAPEVKSPGEQARELKGQRDLEVEQNLVDLQLLKKEGKIESQDDAINLLNKVGANVADNAYKEFLMSLPDKYSVSLNKLIENRTITTKKGAMEWLSGVGIDIKNPDVMSQFDSILMRLK